METVRGSGAIETEPAEEGLGRPPDTSKGRRLEGQAGGCRGGKRSGSCVEMPPAVGPGDNLCMPFKGMHFPMARTKVPGLTRGVLRPRQQQARPRGTARTAQHAFCVTDQHGERCLRTQVPDFDGALGGGTSQRPVCGQVTDAFNLPLESNQTSDRSCRGLHMQRERVGLRMRSRGKGCDAPAQPHLNPLWHYPVVTKGRAQTGRQKGWGRVGGAGRGEAKHKGQEGTVVLARVLQWEASSAQRPSDHDPVSRAVGWPVCLPHVSLSLAPGGRGSSIIRRWCLG